MSGVRSLVLYVLSVFSFESVGIFVDKVFISICGGRLIVNLYLFDKFILDFVSQLVYQFYFKVVDLMFFKLLDYLVHFCNLTGLKVGVSFDSLPLRLEHEFALKFLYLVLYFFDLRVNFLYVFLQVFNSCFDLNNFFFLVFFDLTRYFGYCPSWLYFLVVLGLHLVLSDDFFLRLFSRPIDFDLLGVDKSDLFLDQVNYGELGLFDLVFLDFLIFFFRGLLFFFFTA